jgi:hypothetical protein
MKLVSLKSASGGAFQESEFFFDLPVDVLSKQYIILS